MKTVTAVLLCLGDPLRHSLQSSIPHPGDVRILAAADPREAIDVIARLTPEVVVLLFDGSASGLAAVQDIMSRSPTPILLLRGPGVTSEAVARGLASGAVDEVAMPAKDDAGALVALRGRIRRVSAVPVIRHVRGRSRAPAGASPVVAMAASTGGPQAVASVLSALGGLDASVLVVQHLHPNFIGRFQEWMARESALPVEMATHGLAIRAGVVYLAPGRLHLRLASGRRIALGAEPESLHCPSADVLFSSVAAEVGTAAVGVLLTGMGADGAKGLLDIRHAGGRTMVQDESSSAVYGMARAAESMGAAEQVLGLEQIAPAIFAAIGAQV